MEHNTELLDSLFAEPILWQFISSKYRIFFYQLKYACIGPIACFLTGLILALKGIIIWLGLLLFGGVAIVSLVIICFALSRQGSKIVYTITNTYIMIDYPWKSLVSDFTNISKIKKSRSLFNKNMGTIKFKVKKGLNINYRFAKINNVDSVYELLISLWEEHR